MSSWMFDVETLGLESTTIVLSAALIKFPDGEFTYQYLLDSATFIKFRIDEQITCGRKADIETITWWESQPDDIKSISLKKSSLDVGVIDGLKVLRDQINKSKLQ